MVPSAVVPGAAINSPTSVMFWKASSWDMARSSSQVGVAPSFRRTMMSSWTSVPWLSSVMVAPAGTVVGSPS